MFDYASMDRLFAEFPPFQRKDAKAKEGLKAIPSARYSMIYPPVKDEDAQFGISLKPQLEGAPGDGERAAYCEGGYDVREPCH